MPLSTHLAIDFPSTIPRINPPPSSSVNAAFLDFKTGIPLVLNAAIIIAAVIMVILIAMGGLQYMAANGNEEATTKARHLIFGSIVGFGLILATWAIMHFVFGFIGYSFG